MAWISTALKHDIHLAIPSSPYLQLLSKPKFSGVEKIKPSAALHGCCRTEWTSRTEQPGTHYHIPLCKHPEQREFKHINLHKCILKIHKQLHLRSFLNCLYLSGI